MHDEQVCETYNSALRNVYPKYVEGYDLKVQHILEIIADRLGRLEDKPKVTDQVKVTTMTRASFRDI